MVTKHGLKGAHFADLWLKHIFPLVPFLVLIFSLSVIVGIFPLDRSVTSTRVCPKMFGTVPWSWHPRQEVKLGYSTSTTVMRTLFL